MAIPTGGNKRKGDPVEKPKAKGGAKAKIKGQKFDNQAVSTAAPNVLEGSMKALNKKRAERSTDTDYAPHMKPVQPKPRRESMLVPHPKGKAKTDLKSVAGSVIKAGTGVVISAINPLMAVQFATGYLAREGADKVLEHRRQKKDVSDRKKRRAKPSSIGPTKGKKE